MSESKVIVSPGELYVVGRILNAKYIDYAYVAAVQDIGASFELFEKETTDKLVSMGILEGDFFGSVTPKAETVGLFTPVFFGNLETTLDICTIKEIRALAQRLEIARRLDRGDSYVSTVEHTGASSATVSRVNRCLEYGPGGYRMMLKRLPALGED